MTSLDSTVIGVHLPLEAVEVLDRLAAKAERSRSFIARGYILQALSEIPEGKGLLEKITKRQRRRQKYDRNRTRV